MHPLILPRIKKDMYDTIDEDPNKKPIISENGESKCDLYILFLIILSKYKYILFIFSFVVINIEKEKKRKEDKKEAFTISQIIGNKTNSYTLIQVRISCNPLLLFNLIIDQ